MSKALEGKINDLFEATKDLRNLEEIKLHCDNFNEWLAQNNYKNSTLGTKLSKYGFYKKFKEIPLHQDKNALSIPKHNADGTVKSYELKHYATILCGLNEKQWNERNQTTRVIDRLENSTEIDPDRYLETTGKLLASDDPHELAVGIIAATGRRPHEIIARAKFTTIKDKPYHVLFGGQGKKRGDTPVFEIPTLYPADYVVKALARLQKDSSIVALLREVSGQFPKSETRQNVEIDNRRGQSLRRVVRTYFGDTNDSNPVLAFRHDEKNSNNKGLRAAYAVLATERDCKGGYGAKILHASRILGHFTPKDADDRALGKLGVSVGYSDYYVKKSVRFMEVEQQEKEGNAKVFVSDLQKIKDLQQQWNLPNQREVIRRLLNDVEHDQSLERQLVEAQSKIAHLQEALDHSKQQETRVMDQQSEIIQTDSDSRIDKLEAQVGQMMVMMQQIVSRTTSKTQVEESPVPVPIPTPTRKQATAKDIDWESVSNDQLKSMKTAGAVEEKIFRAFQVIAQYNDNAPSNDDRWYIGSTTLSQVSGCNRGNIAEWIAAHQQTVDDTNNKYGLGQYHNKRHKGIEITDKVKLWD